MTLIERQKVQSSEGRNLILLLLPLLLLNRSYYLTLDFLGSLELTKIHLLLPPECWDSRCESQHPQEFNLLCVTEALAIGSSMLDFVAVWFYCVSNVDFFLN